MSNYSAVTSEPFSTNGIDNGPSATFVAFGPGHLLTVACCTIVITTVTIAGLQLRDEPSEQQLRRGLSVFAIATWIYYNLWWNWNGFDLYNGLPLHICDLASVIGPLALLTLNRWLRAILYFWAFAFSTIAFIQPTVTEGPAHIGFWLFWIVHSIIIGFAVYDVVVCSFRPDWSNMGRAYLVSAGYLLFILPIDLALGVNYGYIGNPPPGHKLPLLLEKLGQWPGRLATIVLVTGIVFFLALLPWLLLDRRRRSV